MANAHFTAEELASEEWRPVVGYEGVYAVSSLGRIRREAVILKTPANRDGYQRAHFHAGDRRGTPPVHAVVASAFLGPRPSGLTVNHIDGDKANNRPTNLEYITTEENVRHAHRNGLIDNFGARNWMRQNPELVTRGERHYRARLTESDVRSIRAARANGAAYPVLAAAYGVCQQTIYAVCARLSWRHVKD